MRAGSSVPSRIGVCKVVCLRIRRFACLVGRRRFAASILLREPRERAAEGVASRAQHGVTPASLMSTRVAMSARP